MNMKVMLSNLWMSIEVLVCGLISLTTLGLPFSTLTLRTTRFNPAVLATAVCAVIELVRITHLAAG
jgi:hypothetical protein